MKASRARLVEEPALVHAVLLLESDLDHLKATAAQPLLIACSVNTNSDVTSRQPRLNVVVAIVRVEQPTPGAEPSELGSTATA